MINKKDNDKNKYKLKKKLNQNILILSNVKYNIQTKTKE